MRVTEQSVESGMYVLVHVYTTTRSPPRCDGEREDGVDPYTADGHQRKLEATPVVLPHRHNTLTHSHIHEPIHQPRQIQSHS